MTEENKLKNFLMNGFQQNRHEEEAQVCEEAIEEEEIMEEPAEITEDAREQDLKAALKDVETELLRIRYMLEDMKAEQPEIALPDMSAYMTTREQFKSVTAAVEKRNGEVADKTLVRAMEAISVMREDFFKLCSGMKERIDKLSPETVLSSFEAYTVDMENILTDAGVEIGAFPYDKLNTLHQRIVGVVPTGDAEKDGKIANRLTDGYKLGDKVLLKEKVDVYKFDPKVAASQETDSETASQETDSKTSDTSQEEEE